MPVLVPRTTPSSRQTAHYTPCVNCCEDFVYLQGSGIAALVGVGVWDYTNDTGLADGMELFWLPSRVEG